MLFGVLLDLMIDWREKKNHHITNIQRSFVTTTPLLQYKYKRDQNSGFWYNQITMSVMWLLFMVFIGRHSVLIG